MGKSNINILGIDGGKGEWKNIKKVKLASNEHLGNWMKESGIMELRQKI